VDDGDMPEHASPLGEPETADQQREIDAETRESEADLVEQGLEALRRRLDRRDDLVEQRERTAGERASAADERAAGQDRRDALADRREDLADARQRRADDRERLADERDAGLERSWLDQREIDLEIRDTEARLRARQALPSPRVNTFATPMVPAAVRPPVRPAARAAALPVVTARLDLPLLADPHVTAIAEGRRLPSWAPDFPAEGDVDIARLIAAARVPSGRADSYGPRLVVERGSGLAVGTAGLFGPPRDGVVEVGYGIVASRQGRGYATEAVRALLALLALDPAVREVVAHAEPVNAASIRVLEKVGLRRRDPRPSSEDLLLEYALPM
jgi:ribosomal-protein-alanine N-acetyltransferase